MKAKIFSSEKWNDTKIDLVKGCEYKYEATGIWIDWFIPCNADGYSKALNSFMDTIFRSVKCRPSAKWFQLIGVIKGHQGIMHEIEFSTADTSVAPESGRLWAVANDADFAYRNNFGCIELQIELNQSKQDEDHTP